MCDPHDYETEDLGEYGQLTVEDLDDLRGSSHPAGSNEGVEEPDRDRPIPTADD